MKLNSKKVETVYLNFFMKSYTLLHQLLDLLEAFEAERPHGESTLLDFSAYLLSTMEGMEVTGTKKDIRFGDKESLAQAQAYKLENNIGRLFIYMSRYAKSYIKKALEETPLLSPDDFTCLSILLTHDELSKTDLIEKNMQEKTSGMEVIRRLIAAGLVGQKNNTEDKRSKRVFITNEGKQQLYKIFREMSYVGTIISGKLTFKEKLILQYLLQKLEDFHYQLHEEDGIGTKSDLAKRAEVLH